METENSKLSIKTVNLTRDFGKFRAVDNVSFSVKKGEIFGFLGANGAGKTTVIRMLCGLLLPTSGEGSVAGYDVYKEAEEIKKHIGYMSQKFSLYEDLRVGENLEFYGGIYGLNSGQLRKRTEYLLNRLDLKEHRMKMTSDIPLGWKQKLALACAIIHEPPILFLDEPTAGVDPASRKEFWDIIYSLSENQVTIFVTTHYMDEAEYCHRLSIMHEGKIVSLGTPLELKRRFRKRNIEDVFICLIEENQRIRNYD